MKLLVTFAQRFTPRAGEIRIDPTVLAFTFVLSVLTGLIFGSIPALLGSASTPRRRCATAARPSPASQRLRRVLIVAQIGASFMLLIAAGLTLRSLMKVQNLDPGFRTEHLLTFRADMAFDRFPLTLQPAERLAKQGEYWRDFEQRLRALPGVASVGAGGTFPLNEAPPFNGRIVREAHPLRAGRAAAVRSTCASPRPTTSARCGQPLLAGRAFARGRRVDGDAGGDRQPVGGAPVLARRGSGRHAHRLGRQGSFITDRRRRRRRAPAARSRARRGGLRAAPSVAAARRRRGS